MRTLSLMDIIMVGIAGMIGGAIFVLTGPAIGLAGDAVIIAFILNAIITLFTAMAYAELGSAMPEAGGGYLWIREGLPRPNAFISGWMAWFAHIIAGSLYAVGFGAFMYYLLGPEVAGVLSEEPLLGIIPFDKVIAVVSIAAFTYINIKGTSETGKAGTIVTLIQLGTIFALIGAGFWTMYNNPDWTTNFADFMPTGVAGLVAAMGLTFIAFEGYEIIVQTGEEVKNPKKNIPRAIFISLAIVVTLYCLVAFVSIGSIFPEGIASWQFIGENGELGIMRAAEMFLPYGVFIVLGGGMVSTLAALNATTFSSARVAFAMGRHYNLPHKLSSIHPVNRTPHVAIIISGVIMAFVAYALPLADIAVAAGVIFLLLFTQVNIAVITIRRIYGDKLSYGFKTPLFPAIPIIGIFLKLGLALYLLVTQPLSWGITVLWILVGFALYRMYTFKREIQHYAPLVTSEGDLKRQDYRILIPYTPENPDRLIKYAIRIAKETAGEVNILRVITVPHQTPLSAGVAFADAAKRSFEPLEKMLDKENIPNHYLVRVSHDATEAILATIEEQKIDVLVTDFETLRRDRKLLTLMTCKVLAIRAENDALELEPEHVRIDADLKSQAIPAGEKKNMVVVYDGGEHSDVVLKATSWLEHSGRFKVGLLSINRGGGGERSSVTMQQDYLSQLGVELKEVQLTESSSKSADIMLSAASSFQPDLVVMGATVGGFSVFNNPDFLALLDQFNCPVIIARGFTIPGVHRAKSLLMRALRK
ncbi:amino acid permease [Candidatus Nitrososphaera gargensis Ga9.2]|uniref:Amino acid permease n=1 Tax=Nitrososphaera gargensis (strain Ga9.2) TaxID=1237085 RepID=K0IIT1_NITGG|nr:amino acid permease [Candidatus Nitrososphaera gargensis Ga9.2]